MLNRIIRRREQIKLQIADTKGKTKQVYSAIQYGRNRFLCMDCGHFFRKFTLFRANVVQYGEKIVPSCPKCNP